jgi:hypothetical protein
VALDRQSIEKRDFPIGRRGYEPAAVDSHLASIAREVEALKRAKSAEPDAPGAEAPAGRKPQSLASVASAQVQAIVEAAEASAYAIEREARDNADQAAKDAARDAQRTRDDAIERSQEHVGKVHEATALMLQRVDAMEGELSALVESLRTGANRLSADLSLLSGNMGELYAAAGRPSHADAPAAPAAAAAPAPPPPAAPAPPAAAAAAPIVEEVVIVEVVDEEDFGELEEEPAQAAAADGDGASSDDDDDIEGARLIALNMALNGQSREETDKYLAENFDLSDRASLLDEVYATVE